VLPGVSIGGMLSAGEGVGNPEGYEVVVKNKPIQTVGARADEHSLRARSGHAPPPPPPIYRKTD
jgi:hypothetical protein